MIHFKYVINMTGDVSNLWRMVFFRWCKIEKGYMETKKSWETLTGSSHVIKRNIKVGSLVHLFIDSFIWKSARRILCRKLELYFLFNTKLK